MARVATRRLRRLSRQYQDRIGTRIDQLSVDPRGGNAKQLRGRPIRWSARVGDYRVVYRILEEERRLRVTDIDQRARIYRRIR